MTNPLIRIIDCANGDTVTDREMTDVEYVQYQADKTKAVADADAQTAKQVARQAVLDKLGLKLGLSADEAQALLG